MSSSITASSELNTGTTAGIAIGGVLLLAGLFVAAVLVAKRKQRMSDISKVSLPAMNAVSPGWQPTENPLQLVPQSTWRAASDGVDSWYVNAETGDLAWVLPAGGVVVD